MASVTTLDSKSLGPLGTFWKIGVFILTLAPLVFNTIFQDIINSGTLIPSLNSFSTWEIIHLDLKMQTTLRVAEWSRPKQIFISSCCFEYDLWPSIMSYRNDKAKIYFCAFAFKLFEHHKRCDYFFCSFYSDHRKSRKIIRKETWQKPFRIRKIAWHREEGNEHFEQWTAGTKAGSAQERGRRCMEAKSGRTWNSVLTRPCSGHTVRAWSSEQCDRPVSAHSEGSTAAGGKGRRLRQGDQTKKKR